MEHRYEEEMLWSRLANAVEYCRQDNVDHGFCGDKTSSVLPIRQDLPVVGIRNWLHRNFEMRYSLFGCWCYRIESKNSGYRYPVAVRFGFDTLDDKMLFVLRWH